MAASDEPKTFPVKLRQSLASPGSSFEKGDIYEAATAVEAHRLVARGIAEKVGDLPKLTAAEVKQVNLFDVATVKAKGNRVRVEPLEVKQARDAEEKRRKREQPRGQVDDEPL